MSHSHKSGFSVFTRCIWIKQSLELVRSMSKRFDRCWHEAGLQSDFVFPPMVKGYCVRRRALIQSLYLRGCINWLQMAHMVLIKDYLTAAGSARGVCTCVSVSVCVCLSPFCSRSEQHTCLCTYEYECLYKGIKQHNVCGINVSGCSSVYIYLRLLGSDPSADKMSENAFCEFTVITL